MKSIKKILYSISALALIFAVFSLSVENVSLESLTANAGSKCVPKTGVDCLSPNGNIYLDYKKGTIGQPSLIEEEEIAP